MFFYFKIGTDFVFDVETDNNGVVETSTSEFNEHARHGGTEEEGLAGGWHAFEDFFELWRETLFE